ncbi:MAG: polysaccharide biosynthesis C-terminal domain-containing protein [Acidobacteria bacterium]|nr:polysaccharide biosynthesis C-terminal domain-containing protein [Acidobacteriota bacterium]
MSALVGIVLPPFLVRHLSPPEYSAWVLILQLSAYISLLDLGIQTAISKFIAEYDSSGNQIGCSRVLSTSFRILTFAALAGMGLIAILTWQVPQLFHQMPATLIRDVRGALLLIGISVAVSLPFNAFLAVFIGLQRYGFPTILLTISKVLSSGTLVVLLLTRPTLLQLAAVIALFNVGTAFAQFLGWRKFAADKTDFSWAMYEPTFAIQILKYCGVLTIWSLSSLLISGLDTVLVGHYDFRNTGYYAIASSVTNFLMVAVGNAFGPLIPAISSLQSVGSAKQIGDVAVNTTRYCAIILFLCGLPVLFGSYGLLSLWVGKGYATQSATYLVVLLVGNMIRQLGYPYALAVVATGKQHLATIAAVAEAVVNISLSIWLIQRMGALGVALGTLAGAIVSIALHVTVSMHFTRSAILIHRPQFLMQGLLRPLVCILPSLVLLPFWRRYALVPAPLPALLAWAVATVALALLLGLKQSERNRMWSGIARLL